ncbi:GNAT family N-acetyltransferase [Streptomyces sp. NBC_00012]|uniref:GNAT family N-acetyltransferase n=1 Tax=Streptomyces sp. NBC_00012 TaxID=2975621 RepID=UPI003244A6B8
MPSVTSASPTDATADWDELAAGLPGVGPYQTRRWGSVVADAFGGTFRVLRVTDPTPRYVPILEGGQLGGDGFCCGHLGYGGVFDADGAPLSRADQIRTIAVVERALGRPCRRLVTGPGTAAEPASGADVRETRLVPLTARADQRLPSYRSRARRAVAKGVRAALTAAPLAAGELDRAAELIWQTQARVGAAYRTPRPLIASLADDGQDFGWLLGCRQGAELVAVSGFIRFAGQAVYLFNGWRQDAAAVAPNYLLMHEALSRFGDLGDHRMDLGYSHRQSLEEFKRTWSGTSAQFVAVDAPTAPRG